MIRTDPERAARALAAGAIAAALLAAMLLVADRPAHAATIFVVNSAADTDDGQCTPRFSGFLSRECTFREAINAANSNDNPAERDTIIFDVVGGSGGVKTISPASELPEITEPVTIDGYTQPAADPNTLEQGGSTNANPLVELEGQSAGDSPFVDGLTIDAPRVTVRGLVINSFPGNGVNVVTRDGTGVRVEGNFIGTDPSGLGDLGNGGSGVFVDGDSGITIGGTTPAARNLISGNGFDGVNLGSSAGNKVQGNLIGLNRGCACDLGNSSGGVLVAGADNTVGGSTPEAANTIAFNDRDGVALSINELGTEVAGNRVLRNSIFSNGEQGIDLNNDGPTPNDRKDLDAGPNTLQNKPLLTSVTTSTTSTTVEGNLNSTPQKTFTIQFFSNPSGDEGKTFLAQRSVTTNSNGNAPFSLSLAKALPAGQAITATATGAGNTSEFSAPR